LAALSTSGDRRQQWEIVRAYWKLVEALANYRYALDYQQQLEQWARAADASPLLRAMGGSAAAAAQEAKLSAVIAQQELAALTRAMANNSLPLPADRPHVGGYRTSYAEMAAVRPLPLRARVLDRVLPLRRETLEARAQAMQAGEQAVAAAEAAARRGQLSLAEAVTILQEYLHERQAWMRAVCRYNEEIAEYAFAVAPVDAGPQTLVNMLIRPTAPIGSSAVNADPQVRPAGGQELAPPLQPPSVLPRPGQTEPTPADPRTRPKPLVPPRVPASSPANHNNPQQSNAERSDGWVPSPDKAGREEDREGDKYKALPRQPLVPLSPP
jgi:hypothetical protein